MIALDEDALICDFAETYKILDMYSLDPPLFATLANGLSENSRIKRKMSGLDADLNSILLAHICDNTAMNLYIKTKDYKKKKNQPKSILAAILKQKKDELQKFKTGEDFLKGWSKANGD